MVLPYTPSTMLSLINSKTTKIACQNSVEHSIVVTETGLNSWKHENARQWTYRPRSGPALVIYIEINVDSKLWQSWNSLLTAWPSDKMTKIIMKWRCGSCLCEWDHDQNRLWSLLFMNIHINLASSAIHSVTFHTRERERRRERERVRKWDKKTIRFRAQKFINRWRTNWNNNHITYYYYYYYL